MGTELKWKWRTDHTMTANRGAARYFVDEEASLLGTYYAVSVVDVSGHYRNLGGSNVMKRAKDMAQRHADTGRV